MEEARYNQEEHSRLEGIAGAVLFRNEENGYTVLRLRCGEEEITAVGCMPGVAPGEAL